METAKLRKRKKVAVKRSKQHSRNTSCVCRYFRKQDDDGGGKEASQHRCRERWKILQVCADRRSTSKYEVETKVVEIKYYKTALVEVDETGRPVNGNHSFVPAHPETKRTS